jgi:hypothetical protein
VYKLSDSGIKWNKSNSSNSFRIKIADILNLNLDARSHLNIIRIFACMSSFVEGKGIISFGPKSKIPQYLILTRINTIYKLKGDITGNDSKLVIVSSQCDGPILSWDLKIELSLNNGLKVEYVPK